MVFFRGRPVRKPSSPVSARLRCLSRYFHCRPTLFVGRRANDQAPSDVVAEAIIGVGVRKTAVPTAQIESKPHGTRGVDTDTARAVQPTAIAARYHARRTDSGRRDPRQTDLGRPSWRTKLRRRSAGAAPGRGAGGRTRPDHNHKRNRVRPPRNTTNTSRVAGGTADAPSAARSASPTSITNGQYRRSRSVW